MKYSENQLKLKDVISLEPKSEVYEELLLNLSDISHPFYISEKIYKMLSSFTMGAKMEKRKTETNVEEKKAGEEKEFITIKFLRTVRDRIILG